MIIHCLSEPPDSKTTAALAVFEKDFTYPLGADLSFAISHGADYSRFFRSMGETKIYLAEISGEIVGALATVQRHAIHTNGSTFPAIYLCDAKVASAHRGRTVLGRLAIKAREDVIAADYQAAYSVVMSGSIPTTAYTGRLGIPAFKPISEQAVLRFETPSEFRRIAIFTPVKHENHLRFQAGNAALTSEIRPQILEVDGATGVLVDTRRGKRLWQSDGREIISAHLTRAIFSSAQALADLITLAVEQAAALGFPGLFLSLAVDDPALALILDSAVIKPTIAYATVYGTGLPVGRWAIETSEI
jgi:Acetyltransferase (GNAT) domain